MEAAHSEDGGPNHHKVTKETEAIVSQKSEVENVMQKVTVCI